MAESTPLNASSAPIADPSTQASETSVPLSPSTKKGKRRVPGGASNDNDSTARLLQSLGTQLEYYFSDQNLSRDTYLRTIMSLNSGYVPTTVLATFAKVNLLLNRYDTNHEALDKFGDVPSLVGEAARRSTLLEVVIVNAEGKVVNKEQNEGSGTDVKEQGERSNADRHDAEKTATATDKANQQDGVRLVAVGLKQGATIPVATAAAEGVSSAAAATSSAAQITAPPKGTQQPVVAVSPSSDSAGSNGGDEERNTIILRDMPDGAVEDDVRSIFTGLEKAPGIHSIHSDVGNCWFVTLEPTPKDELVNLLMALRNKKCKGQAIRPRLKTESSVKSFYTATAPTTAPAPVAPIVSHPPGSTRPVYNKANAGGPPRRPPGGGQRYSGGAPQSYQGEKAAAGDRSTDQRSSTGRSTGDAGGRGGPGGGGQAERGTGRVAHGGKSRGSGKGGAGANGGGDSSIQNSSKPKKVAETQPPPPLLESHFPALGGDKAANVTVAKDTADATVTIKGDKKEEEVKVGNAEVQEDDTSSKASASSADKVVGATEAKKPVAGYAAALLKAAPPRPSTPPTPTKTNSKSQPKKGNNGKEQKSGKATPRKVPATPPADDTSSAGERSAGDRSAVSKTDSEKSANVAAVAPSAPTWGGGKTFADILKKKNAGDQAEAKTEAEDASAQS